MFICPSWRKAGLPRPENPEAYKLFLLFVCAGLRRGEADVCLWRQLNAADNSIRIEANAYIEPKHGSGGIGYVAGPSRVSRPRHCPAPCPALRIELWLRDIKTLMGMQVLRCRSPGMVHKGLEMFFIASYTPPAANSSLHTLAVRMLQRHGAMRRRPVMSR